MMWLWIVFIIGVSFGFVWYGVCRLMFCVVVSSLIVRMCFVLFVMLVSLCVVNVVIDMWFFWFVEVGSELIDVGCVSVLFFDVSVVVVM